MSDLYKKIIYTLVNCNIEANDKKKLLVLYSLLKKTEGLDLVNLENKIYNSNINDKKIFFEINRIENKLSEMSNNNKYIDDKYISDMKFIENKKQIAKIDPFINNDIKTKIIDLELELELPVYLYTGLVPTTEKIIDNYIKSPKKKK